MQQSQPTFSQHMDLMFVYVTTPSHETALRLGRMIIEARLAACANILGPVHSVYWWQDHMEEGHEVALLLKTRENLVENVVSVVQAFHKDTCPCVIAIPIVAGNPAFLEWIVAETRTLAPAAPADDERD